MIKSKHSVAFCELCDTNMVICATCGNNCCNGGSGQVDGKTCPDCDEAYEHQKIMWDNGDIEFSE